MKGKMKELELEEIIKNEFSKCYVKVRRTKFERGI